MNDNVEIFFAESVKDKLISDFESLKRMGVELTLENKTSIKKATDTIEADPSVGFTPSVPIAGEYCYETHIGNNLWFALNYNIRNQKGKRLVEVVYARIGYKM